MTLACIFARFLNWRRRILRIRIYQISAHRCSAVYALCMRCGYRRNLRENSRGRRFQGWPPCRLRISDGRPLSTRHRSYVASILP